MDRESQENSSQLDAVEIELADWITVRVLGGQLLLLSVGLAVLLAKLWWLRRAPARLLQRGSQIQQILAQILEVAGADRVSLYEVIHYGGWRLFGGSPFGGIPRNWKPAEPAGIFEFLLVFPLRGDP